MDAFTERRLIRFVGDFRAKTGTAPTLRDFEQGGFAKDLVEDAVRSKLLEQFYVNQTNGSVVKTYRVKVEQFGDKP